MEVGMMKNHNIIKSWID